MRPQRQRAEAARGRGELGESSIAEKILQTEPSNFPDCPYFFKVSDSEGENSNFAIGNLCLYGLHLLLYNRLGKPGDMQRIIRRSDAHQRLLISLAIAVITFLLTLGQFKLSVQLILTWNGFALTALVLAWLKILFAEARTTVRTAKLQDTSARTSSSLSTSTTSRVRVPARLSRL